MAVIFHNIIMSVKITTAVSSSKCNTFMKVEGVRHGHFSSSAVKSIMFYYSSCGLKNTKPRKTKTRNIIFN